MPNLVAIGLINLIKLFLKLISMLVYIVITKKKFSLQRETHAHSRRDKCRLRLVPVVVCMSVKCRYEIKSEKDERGRNTRGMRVAFFLFIF